jgi:tripartite-type tricarboxylate transporter receptor subunit TctC
VGDFTPIAPALFAPMVLLVNPALNVHTGAELLERVRKNPGKMSFAVGSAFQRLAGEMFRDEAKLDVQYVPYKGSAQSMTDLIGGHVDYTFVDLAAGMPQIRGGALKPLAVTSAKRVSALPDVPTMAEAGLPDIRLNGWAGIFVKKGTPPAAVDELRRVFNEYFLSPEYQQYIGETGGFLEPMSVDELNAFIATEIARAKDVFQRAGVQPE